MVVSLANKTQFREDILSNRIEEIVYESFQRQLGKSVGGSELASWKHSLRQIGRRIVEEEQGGAAKSTYGERLLPELSRALSAEFGRGFSFPNLRNFRQFYLTYPDPEICYALNP